jgi:hypothetical protein
MDRNILGQIASADQDACIKMIQALGPTFYNDMLFRLCEIDVTGKHGFYEFILDIKNIPDCKSLVLKYFRAIRCLHIDDFEVEYKNMIKIWLEKKSGCGTDIAASYSPSFANIVEGYKHRVRIVSQNKRRVIAFLRAFKKYDGGRIAPEHGISIPILKSTYNSAWNKFFVVRVFKNKFILIKLITICEDGMHLHLPIDTLNKIIY